MSHLDPADRIILINETLFNILEGGEVPNSSVRVKSPKNPLLGGDVFGPDFSLEKDEKPKTPTIGSYDTSAEAENVRRITTRAQADRQFATDISGVEPTGNLAFDFTNRLLNPMGRFQQTLGDIAAVRGAGAGRSPAVTRGSSSSKGTYNLSGTAISRNNPTESSNISPREAPISRSTIGGGSNPNPSELPRAPFVITSPRTSAQTERRLRQARQALIAPHISRVGSNVIFNPSREELLRITNPNLTDAQVREAQGRLADAETRLSDNPTTLSYNPSMASELMRIPPVEGAIESGMVFRNSDLGRLTPISHLSPRSFSRTMFGDFSDPATWAKRTPIVMGDDAFASIDNSTRAFFDPNVLSADAMRASTSRPPRGVDGPRGAIFVRGSRTPENPDLRSIIRRFSPDVRTNFSQSVFGPSSLERLMKTGRLSHDITHELGHSPTHLPDDWAEIARKTEAGIPLSPSQKKNLDKFFITAWTGTATDPLSSSGDYQKRTYDLLPAEWIADLQSKIRDMRSRGVVGPLSPDQIRSASGFAEARRGNPMRGIFVPPSDIQETDPRLIPTSIGRLSIPMDLDPEISTQIKREIIPHLQGFRTKDKSKLPSADNTRMA